MKFRYFTQWVLSEVILISSVSKDNWCTKRVVHQKLRNNSGLKKIFHKGMRGLRTCKFSKAAQKVNWQLEKNLFSSVIPSDSVGLSMKIFTAQKKSNFSLRFSLVNVNTSAVLQFSVDLLTFAKEFTNGKRRVLYSIGIIDLCL